MRTVLATLLLATAILSAGPSSQAADSKDLQAPAGEAGLSWKDKNVQNINAVRDLIADWANSWQEKNIDRYMSYYSPAFRSGGLDYAAWQDKKAGLFTKSGNLSLKVSDLWVVVQGDQASASFIQHYRNENYADVGKKTINLVQDDGKWKIISEEWQPLSR